MESEIEKAYYISNRTLSAKRTIPKINIIRLKEFGN